MTGPITESLQAQRDYAIVQLSKLERRGVELRDALAADSSAPARQRAATGVWQQDCAAAIHQLAGGSKAHWLSRAFSQALLVRSTSGDAVVEADLREIVRRIIEVLERARQSLSQMEQVEIASSTAAPSARRFDFVHNATLRPILEQAFDDSARGFDARDFTGSLSTSCSILEAILTDALEHRSMITGRLEDWSFDMRIAAAEKTGLIRGGCARLTAVARAYRDDASFAAMTVTARDAKVARQVLHVVMRDLDPGR